MDSRNTLTDQLQIIAYADDQAIVTTRKTAIQKLDKEVKS